MIAHKPQNAAAGDTNHYFHDRIRTRTRFAGLVMERINLFEFMGRATPLEILHTVGFNLAHALENFIKETGNATDPLLRIRGDFTHAFTDIDNRINTRGKNENYHQR